MKYIKETNSLGLVSMLCLGVGRPDEGDRWQNIQSVKQSEHTQHLSIKFAILWVQIEVP